MPPKTTPGSRMMLLFSIFYLFIFCNPLQAQEKIFATQIVNFSHADSLMNSVDGSLESFTRLQASSGTILGQEAYNGHLELQFPGTIPANHTTYIKMSTQDGCLRALLGGSIGHTLAETLGIVLIGHQEFSIEAKMNETIVLSGNSEDDGAFDSSTLRVVVDDQDQTYLAITPTSAYNRLRITNRLGALLGLDQTRFLDVYSAFYVDPADLCGNTTYTSFDGTGITADLINIGGAGVSNPQFAIDDDGTTYSEISLGIIGVAGSMEQTVYFEGGTNNSDTYEISFRVDPSLLALGIVNAIEIIGQYGETIVYSAELSELLNLEILGLLQSYDIVKLTVDPGSAIDRLTVRYNALLNTSLSQRIDLYDINRVIKMPILDQAASLQEVCEGEPASLVAVASPASLELRWYDMAEGGSPIGTSRSGEAFTTPPVFTDKTFYVSAGKSGCEMTSARLAVAVTTIDAPDAQQLSVSGNESAVCADQAIRLNPHSDLAGIFKWYLDPQKEQEITDGTIIDGLLYGLTTDGVLSVSGFGNVDADYSLYLSILDNSTGCENPAGDLLHVPFNVRANTLSAGLAIEAQITADNIINYNESQNTVTISASATGDATAGDLVQLLVNGKEFVSALTGDFTATFSVPGSDLASDPDLTIEMILYIADDYCSATATDNATYQLDITPPQAPTVMSLSTTDTSPVLQGTALSEDTLTLVVNGITYTEGDGFLTDHGNDSWSLNIPESNALPEGIYDVSAITRDQAGNEAQDHTTDELIIDLTAPDSPTVKPLATADHAPEIYGSANSADILEVSVNGITYTEGDGNLEDMGNNLWRLSIPISNAIPDGTYDVVATLSDAAGNISTDSSTDELVIDSTIPVNPTVNPMVTASTTPALTGTAISTDILRVTVNGIQYTEGDGQLADNGDDTWVLQIPPANSLADGIYDIHAEATNGSVSAYDATVDELRIDTTAPDVPTVQAQQTQDSTPEIRGTATSAEQLQVIINNVTYTEGDGNLTDLGDDNWSLVIPMADELGEGIYEVKAVLTDNAGNSTTDTTTDELEVDLTAPVNPTVDFLLTNDPSPVLTGTADSATDLEIIVNGILYTESEGTVIDHGDNRWSLEIPEDSPLPDAVYNIEVVARDIAGNTSTDQSIDELEIDTESPAIPRVEPKLTTDNTPMIYGTSDPESTLTVILNGISYSPGDGHLTVDSNGSWTLQLPDTAALPDGSYDVTAISTDGAGNQLTDSTALELTVDQTAPTAPTINTTVSNTANPTLGGTASSADLLTVKVNGITYSEGDGYLTDNGDDTWTLVLPSSASLPDGIYDVIARLVDTAGNQSTDQSLDELIIDTMAPAPPTVDILNTDNQTPLITGQLDSTTELTVIVNGISYTEGDGNLIDHGNGNWSLLVPEENRIPEGTYDVQAQSTDEAGNSSTDQSLDELHIELSTEPNSDIVISFTSDRDHASQDEEIIFTVTVTNTGDTSYSELLVQVLIDRGLDVLHQDPSSGTYNLMDGNWNIPSLGANASITLVISVRTVNTGQLLSSASLLNSQPSEASPGNNTVTKEVFVSCIKVYNEFTPNKDGKNDIFRISCIEQYPQSDLKIYNRYGNMVFQTRGYNNDWTGIANVGGVVKPGQPLPSATYYYILTLDEDQEIRKGWLFIKR